MFDQTDLQLNDLAQGAFLSSGGNVMTIGWGGVGYLWRKRVFFAPVRYSRYTKKFIDETDAFAVSFPAIGTLKKELKLCGTESGRSTDKRALLATQKAQKIDTFLINGCESYLECRVVAKIPLEAGMLGESVKDFYRDGDYHILYVGEIL